MLNKLEAVFKGINLLFKSLTILSALDVAAEGFLKAEKLSKQQKTSRSSRRIDRSQPTIVIVVFKVSLIELFLPLYTVLLQQLVCLEE